MACQSRIEFVGGEASALCLVTSKPREDLSDMAAYKRMVFYGVRPPGPGSDIVGDVVEWFATRAEAERFIAEVASEPNPEDAVLATALSIVEVDLHGPEAAQPSLS